MSGEMIRKLVIVGGGTAGWMTATLLSKLTRNKFAIELVESEEIGIIGVGEATIPAIKIYNQLIGLDEAEMMRETKGTFKLGIEFVNWREQGHSYIHGFGKIGADIFWMRTHQFWARMFPKGGVKDFDNFCIGVVAARQNKFAMPSANDPNSPLADIDYAFQFDAALYGQYLRRLAESNGVKRTEGKIVKVNQDANNGFIKSLDLENGTQITGDFFIDCSGSRGLLIAQTLGSGFDDYQKWLLCDRAWALPCSNAETLTPYTRSTAHEAGWRWRIPLQHRIGNGNVFSNAHMGEQMALDQLVANLDGEVLGEPRLVRFTPGKRSEVFKKNCVAIGLSSGFLEPLESTAIHLIQTAILRFLALFPSLEYNQSLVDEYNRQTTEEYEFIRDFIIAHYKVTNREDSEFWRYCKNMDVPQSLSHRIELMRTTGRFFKRNEELFREESWVQVLIGQGLEITPDTMTNLLSDDEAKEFLGDIVETIAENVARMRPHQDYINSYCKA